MNPGDCGSADLSDLERAFARRGDRLTEIRLALVDALQALHTENDQLRARIPVLELQNEKLHDGLIAANAQNELLEAKIAATLSARVKTKIRNLRNRA